MLQKSATLRGLSIFPNVLLLCFVACPGGRGWGKALQLMFQGAYVVLTSFGLSGVHCHGLTSRVVVRRNRDARSNWYKVHVRNLKHTANDQSKGSSLKRSPAIVLVC